MAIFRGIGGAGDSTTDATVTAVTEQAVNAATSATQAASSASSAASSASSASTSATNAAASASTASDAATAAQTAQTNAETAETNAETAQAAAEAAQTAAETAETNAETAETNATTAQAAAEAAQAAAETAEINAETAEANTLAIFGDAQDVQDAVDSASASASTATTQAGIATTQAGIATTKAGEAASSATDAETAQTAAETAQGLAETARDEAVAAQEAIDGLYLGTNTSNPTVDLNGDPVTVGDWYFNTTDNTTRIYDGNNWNTVNPDLIGDTTPQLGGDLDTNGNDIKFGDNDKATFGASDALEIYHNSSEPNSYIQEKAGGRLILQTNGPGITLKGNTETYATFDNNDAVSLYFDGSKKFETTSSGVDVTGTLVSDGLTVDGSANAITLQSPSQNVRYKITDGTVEGRLGVDGGVDVYSGSVSAHPYKLRSNDTKRVEIAANGDISFYDDAGTSQDFYWDASTSWLGLGTTIPSSPLQVDRASTDGDIVTLSKDGSTVGSIASYFGSVIIGKADTALRFNDAQNTITPRNVNGSNVDNAIDLGDSVSRFKDLYLSEGLRADTLKFSSLAGTEHMRITLAGNVGIGTTSPSKLLEVNGDAKFVTTSGIGLQLHNDSSNQSYIQFTNTATGETVSNGFQIGIDGAEEGRIWHYRGEPIKFATSNTERMRIDSSGNVGIGTTSPSTALDVNGTITSDQNLLEAIDTTIADTAVDVFVYDTRKDSDGGAWRKRTQHTSWYNETLNTSTRGSRREFPAVAVIVAESDTVTIYDGDDPELPMWMVFDGISNNDMLRSGFRAITALNGRVVAAGSSALALTYADFIADTGAIYSQSANSGPYKGNVKQRNDALSWVFGVFGVTLVNNNVNDVAMTVLPNAPIDSATGLPIPTIAVATEGGVSVIKDDGTVVSTNGNVTNIHLNNKYVYADYTNTLQRDYVAVWPIENTGSVSLNTTGPSGGGSWHYDHIGSLNSGVALWLLNDGDAASVDAKLSKNSVGTESGLSLIDENITTPSEGMVAYTTSSYNTGWMNGDTKLATLSDTDDTDVTGTELVTNGTFDTDTDWAKGTGWTISGGVASCDGTQTASTGLYQDGVVTPGSLYVLTFDLTVSSGSISALFGQPGGLNLTGSLNSSQTVTVTGIAPSNPSSNTRLLFEADSNFVGTIDNVSVRLAEPDRSVNGNGLQVFGTITKDPVATGADLVAYTGFGTSGNYLKQPYNNDLNLGTGDFCIISWIKQSAYTNTYTDIIDKAEIGTNTGRLELLFSQDDLRLYIGGTVTSASSVGIPDVWLCVAAVRLNGVVTLYVNGEEKASGTNSGTITNANGDGTFIGVNYTGSNRGQNKELALLRISATAPTADQIKKIYEDEKVLFQENAQATLYGSSDAVTALAHDDDTNLLHVGTSAGRSVFQGLRRVDNTTDAVGTAISASNGMVVDE